MISLFEKLHARYHPASCARGIDRLIPLLQLVQPEMPPVGLLARIEGELDGLNAPPMTRYWQPKLLLPAGIAGVIAGAAGLALFVMPLATTTCAPVRLAALLIEPNAPSIDVDSIVCGRYLRLSHAGVQSGAGHALELWLIPGNGRAPLSLGLVSVKGNNTLLETVTAIATGDTLAISKEPLSGSPKKGPSGPVLATARIGKVG